MHEWALVDAILAAADKLMKENTIKQVDEIVVVLGELQNVDEEGFREIFNNLKLTYDETFDKTEVLFETEPAKFTCLSCKKEFSKKELHEITHNQSESIHFIPELARVFMKCPSCGSPDFKITAGRGVYLKEIRGE